MSPEPVLSSGGIVRAWVCGRCGFLHTGDQALLPEPASQPPTPVLREAFAAAEQCCTCPSCGGPSCRDKRLCVACHNAKREADVHRDSATLTRMREAIERAKGGAR